jgi:hypothetical protein
MQSAIGVITDVGKKTLLANVPFTNMGASVPTEI